MMVSRDPLNSGSAFVNPLKAKTDEEKKLLALGDLNRKKRLAMVFELFKRFEKSSKLKAPVVGSGGGSVGRAVASYTRGPRFDSHR